MNGKRVLVTGGLGYVGSVLVPMLISNGYEVTIADSMMHENNHNSLLSYVGSIPLIRHPNFKGVKKVDVTNEEAIKKVIPDADYIIHLAAIVGAPLCEKFPELAKMVNINGTKNIVNNMSPNQKILYASTGSVYGHIDGICDENSTINPLSVYGLTKAEAERLVLSKGGVAFRFATAFGVSPRFRMDLLPNDLTHKLMTAKHLELYEADARRTFIHVSDMARAFIYAMENYDKMSGKAFNAGNDNMNCTKKQLAEKIQKRLNDSHNLKTSIWIDTNGKFHDPDQRDYEVSYAKLREAGFDTTVSLDDGIFELVNFYLNLKMKNPFSNF